MAELRDLYHEEEETLKNFRNKIRYENLTRKDLLEFTEHYQDLLAQSKVITRVSDRLQSKLNKANDRIREQNEEITEKNQLLENTINQLVRARVGRKASTIILTVAIVLFLSEEMFLESLLDTMVNSLYLSLGIKGGIALLLKFLEGGLETFFMKQEQIKILKEGKAVTPEIKEEEVVPGLKIESLLK